ncbi:sensor histidine kinase [Nocardiopsis sediminis]|uniref:histidine kinase n=1 Tax=Nocardiopsis sediminis TaxID=1778267 RepID=A0ABV8FXG0_9ACTN
MINGVVLAVLALAAELNGVDTVGLPAWRQFLYLPLGVASYLHGRHLPSAWDRWVLAGAGAVGAAAMAVDRGQGVTMLFSLALAVALPWLAGRFRRQQSALIEAGRERIATLEREQGFIAERARLRERARISADMHDSLGHELALITVRAGALELAAEADAGTREAAAGLRASAVAATDLLRRTIGMLNEDRDAATEPPGEPVEALVARSRDAGMAVGLALRGGTGPLPPLVDRAVHRVVQEALTNAARHAPGARVSVTVERGPDAVVVTVANPVAGPGPAGSGSGSGSGLAGLRERVGLLGGDLRAGPSAEGFTVAARIPVEPHTAGTAQHGDRAERGDGA